MEIANPKPLSPIYVDVYLVISDRKYDPEAQAMAEALGIAGTVLAIAELSAKIGSYCVEYCKAVKNARNDIERIRVEIDSLQGIASNALELLEGPRGAQLKASRRLAVAVRRAESRLKLLEVELRPSSARQALSRMRIRALKWPFKSKEIEGVVKDIEQCTRTLSFGLQLDIAVGVLDIDEKLALDKLPTAPGASYDSQAEELSATCLPDTRVELLQKIRAWANDPTSQAVFWLKGMAGTGKSTVSRTVAQEMAEHRQLGASFFFKRGEADRSNASKVFTTMALQLVSHLPMLAQHVKEVIDAEPRIYDKRLQDQFEKLIFEPLLKVQRQPYNNRYVIIVVDALDECERDDHIKTVVRLLCRVKDIRSPRLKVFITSRPELPVRLGFSQDAVKGTYDDFLLHEIPQSIVEHDLSAFLLHELEKIRADYNSDVSGDRQLPPTWPDQSDIKTLVMMAVPLFIFAATTCRFLTQRKFGDPRHQLRQVLKYKIGTGSSEVDLQSKLELTYQPALEQQLTELSSFDQEKVIEQFRRIVGPIVILKSPLSTTALEKLLGIPRHVIDGRLDMLHSVLSIPQSSTSPVRLLHLSFRDFLVDPKQQSRNRFWVDERRTHRQLAAKCLALLNQSLHEDMCDLRAPATLRATVDVQKINKDLTPEVQYACLHWTYHTDQAGDSESLARDVDDFLRSHFLHWLETLSLMGRAFDSLSLLKSLQNKLTISCEGELRHFLSDAARFIRLNLFAIDAAPLQLYSSAIVFAPHESIVRQTFEGKVPSWILLRPHADMNWDQCLQKFQGHSDYVRSVAFSHDSTLVASASVDKTVRIWHADTGECTEELKGHSDYVRSVAFSHDSTLVASASDDTTVRIWHADTGECTEELKGHSRSVRSVAFSHDSTLVASASDDKTVRIWHADTGERMQELKGHSDPVNSVAFSHDSTLVASASDDKTVRIWHADTGECTQELKGHSDYVRSVAFSHDSTLVASASRDKTVRIWHADTGECMQELKGHSSFVNSVAFSHDSKLVASASWDKTVRIWHADTGECMQELKGHSDSVNSVAFSHDSKLVASASDDKTVRIWHADTGECTQELKGHSNWVNSVAFSHDSTLVASASDDKTVRIWHADTGECTEELKGHSSSVNSVAFSHDSKLVASASWDKTVRIWHVDTGECTEELKGHSNGVNSVAFSHDSTLVASASVDKTVRIWHADTGECMQELKGHSSSVNLVAFSHDSTLVASASSDYTVRIWHADTGECTQAVNIGRVTQTLSFEPSNAYLRTDKATIAMDKASLRQSVWKIISEHDTTRLRIDIGISPDGSWITWHDQNLLWLPVEFRPSCSALLGSTLAIGCPSGRVVVLRLANP